MKSGNKVKKGKGGSDRQIRRAFAKHEVGNRPETDTRVMTNYLTVSGVTGAIIGASMSSQGVTSATEFASMAARYQEYRVLAMRVRWRPRFCQSAESAGLTVAESGVPLGCTFVVTAPSTVAGVVASEGFKTTSNISKALEMEVAWEVNPNAKLWTNNSIAVPLAQSFGITIRHANLCPATLNGQTVVDIFIEYDVQWRTAV